jgi:hypothetical protein
MSTQIIFTAIILQTPETMGVMADRAGVYLRAADSYSTASNLPGMAQFSSGS